LIYRTISQGRIRFNPFEEVKFEAVEHKPRFLNKGDVAKHLSFPLLDEGHSAIASTQIYVQITDQKIARNMDRLIEKCKTRRK
jgi:hypothetical protein